MPRTRGRPAPGPLVLDTHVWIWAMEGSGGDLSNGTVRVIEQSAASGDVAVAAISVWELAMLEAKGRISLSRSVEEWVSAALTAPGVRLVDLAPEIALDSTRLPGLALADPADRMIIATARVFGATLVTCDERILTYGKAGHVRVRNGRARN